MVSELKPPAELGAAGRRLWRKVAREVAEEGMVLDSREEYWLYSAAKIADQLAVLEEAMAEQPLWVRGSMGQLVPNGMLAEVRSHRLLAAQLLARIKLNVDDESPGVLGGLGTTSTKARASANRRWRPGTGA